MDCNIKKNKEIIEKYPQIKKTINYLLNKQLSDGSYPTLNPDPVNSIYFLGIAKELGIEPSDNTIRWVKSLQTGKRGFGETTGENSWDYTTYWGSKMHNYLGIKPQFLNEISEYIHSHQNDDGGFSDVVKGDSSINATINWCSSLIELGLEIKNKDKLEKYIKNVLKSNAYLSLDQLYHITEILKEINCLDDVKKVISRRVKDNIKGIPNFMLDVQSKFYYFYIMKTLGGKETSDVNEILKQKEDGSIGDFYSVSPRTTYYAVKLIKLFDPKTIEKIKPKIINYVKSNELKCGGFSNINDKNTHSAYCCVSALDIFGLQPLKKDELILWIKNCQNDDGGFGYSPNSFSSEKATFWSLEILRILNALNVIDKDRLLNFLSGNIKNTNPFTSYYVLGCYDILNITPENYEEIVNNLLLFLNEDGGFSSVPGGDSQMYETFRAVNAINFIDRVLNRNGIKEEFKNKVKNKVIKWVMSCEIKEGGFSWIPDERPYIQPTYHATEILSIFKEKSIKKHLEWVLKFQNEDGGFNGGVEGTPSDVHFSFWSIKIIENVFLN
jgi:hypothetical protein